MKFSLNISDKASHSSLCFLSMFLEKFQELPEFETKLDCAGGDITVMLKFYVEVYKRVQMKMT